MNIHMIRLASRARRAHIQTNMAGLEYGIILARHAGLVRAPHAGGELDAEVGRVAALDGDAAS